MLTVLSLAVGTGNPQPASRWQSGDFEVEFFPVAPYHVGDFISARVTYTGPELMDEQTITIALADNPDQVLETTKFSQHTNQAIFYWFFNTHQAEAGFIDFVFTIPEMNTAWQAGIHLLPNPGNRQSTWSVAHTPCCTLHYLTGSDAETNLDKIIDALEQRTETALAQFAAGSVLHDNPLEEPLTIVLSPIVLGHGGFATDEAVLTYSDHNWAGIEFEILAHHELVHVIDRRINTESSRPSLFVEGIAVFLSGGHYRVGDPLQRAAALLALDLYIPISEIVNDFYAAQHEIGYMEAAGLVAYLDMIWGWETLIDFYFNLPEGPSDEVIISSALQARFGLDLAELEQNFIAYLEALDPDPAIEADVRLTVDTYNNLRRYQRLMIPSAHFRTAWWPPVDQMRERGIVGDYAYREKTPLNIIIEDLFIEVHAALQAADYAKADATLATIDDIIAQVENAGGTLSHYAIGWPLGVPIIMPSHP
jgi:hypothetical protein